MSALTVSQDPEQSWDDLVRFWEEMEWPEGSKVEIIEGIITVSPAPASRHNVITERIQRRLYTAIPDDWGVFQTLAIAVPSRLGMLIPGPRGGAGAGVRGNGDPHPGRPRRTRRRGDVQVQRPPRPSQQAPAYATAGIPLYLLIDRWASNGPTATLYGEPKGDVYRPLSTAKFGEAIRLPAPFDVVIDTGEFPVD